MPLNIRDPRAQKLAQALAKQRGMTMTAVIIDALEKETKVHSKKDLVTRMKALQKSVAQSAKPGGRVITKAEIDDLWGHE